MSCVSEPESLYREGDIISCGSEVSCDIFNRVVAPQNSTTEVVICPDFQNCGLKVKSSSEIIVKPKVNACFKKFKNPRPLKERFTWQQKQRWRQSNKVSSSLAVNARRSSEGVLRKRTFQNKGPIL